MSGEEQHRATSEAKQHVVTRPVTAPGHESGVARYLGAQHYRERRIHREEQETPAQVLPDDEPGPESDEAVPNVP